MICLGSSGLTAKLGSPLLATSSLLPGGIMSVILRLVRAPTDWKEGIDPKPNVRCMSEVKVLCTPWEGVDLRTAVIDAEDPVTPAGSGCKGRVNGPVSKEAGRIDA